MRRIGMRATVPLLAVAALTANPTGAEASFITNGSFELPDVPHGNAYQYYVGTTSIPGWTVGGAAGNYVLIFDYNGVFANGDNTPYGAQWLYLGGNAIHPTVSQTVSGLTAGATYQLSFAIASAFPYSGVRDGAVVTIDQGGTPLTQTFIDNATLSGGSGFFNFWGTQTFQFVATTTSATVSFTGMTGANNVGLDNVDLTEVAAAPVAAPAPPGVLLALTGVASLGGFGWLRRRCVKSVPA